MNSSGLDPEPFLPAAVVRRLHPEIERWRALGLIDPGTAERIHSLYPAAKPGDWRGRLVTALSIMAATLLGLGVIMFFAANWEGIPRWGKLALVSVLLIGTYAAGYQLKYRRGYPLVGGALIFLGAILYGSAIYLVAQAFNLREHYANGFLLWAIGILPLALVTSSPYILILFTAVFCAWSGTESLAFQNFGPFPVLVILGVVLPLAYAFKNRMAAAAGIAALGYFLIEGLIYETVAFNRAESNFFVVMAVFGCLLWCAGEAHRLVRGLSRYSSLYQVPGLALVLAALYGATFPWVLHELSRHTSFLPANAPFAGFAMLAMLALILAGAFILPLRAPGGRNSIPELAAAAVISLLLIIVGMFSLPALPPQTESASGLALLFNLVLFGLLAGMIVHGHRRGRPLLVNAGLAMFALAVATRYVDFFWGLMPTSLFFIVGGIWFLAGGIFLEKQRRRLVARPEGIS